MIKTKKQKIYLEKAKEVRKRLKLEILHHYSPDLKCTSCGFSDIRSLSIDHIKGNGNKHRKEIGSGNLYQWIKKNNFPKGFQVLCFNCQWIKRDENNEVNKGGYVTKRKLSKVQCLGCGEVLLSKYVHDFQHCSCPNYTFVDGGSEYCRYGGMNMNKILIFNPNGSSQIAGKKQNVKKQIQYQNVGVSKK